MSFSQSSSPTKSIFKVSMEHGSPNTGRYSYPGPLDNNDKITDNGEGSPTEHIDWSLPSIFEFYRKEISSQTPAIASRLQVQRERIENFLRIPYEIERLMMFGYLLCLDSFLTLFTVIPLRTFGAIFNLLRLNLKDVNKSDLLKAGLLCASVWLIGLLDASRLYHAIRGQSVLKLYVIFNVLEVHFSFNYN
jgi:hypothetical protein